MIKKKTGKILVICVSVLAILFCGASAVFALQDGSVAGGETVTEVVYGQDSLAWQIEYTIKGHIRDLSGNPLENIKIYLDTEANYALTDKNGMFTIEEVYGGTHKLCYMQDERTPYVLGTLEVESVADTFHEINVEYDINTDNGVMVCESGRIFDTENNSGIKDARLEFTDLLTGESYVCFSDSEGLYAVELPMGEYKIELTKEGFRTVETTVSIGRTKEENSRRRK